MISLGRSFGKVDLSEFQTAIKTINQGLEILEALKLKGVSVRGYLYLGELYSDLGSKKDAIENLQKAKTMCQEMGIDYWLPKIREMMAKL